MRCKICKNKIITRLSKIDIRVEGKNIEVLNIPAFYCQNCNKDFFHDIVIKKAEYYALANNTKDVIDYKEIEEEETDEMVAVGLINNTF